MEKLNITTPLGRLIASGTLVPDGAQKSLISDIKET